MREDVRARTLNVCMMCITTYVYCHACARLRLRTHLRHTGVNNDAPRVNIMY
jgi:hypothetical protein